MNKNISVSLGEYFSRFVKKEVDSGRYNSPDEVVRAALRFMEEDLSWLDRLRNELDVAENSPIREDFDPVEFLKEIHTENP